MVCIVCSTPKSPDKSRFKLHTMAKNGVQDSVHGVQGSVHEQRNAQIDMPSPCRTPSVRSPTSDCRPQGGHPCIERMRDAHGRSNVLRPLQRRFKARKKPEGYTSTPTGLKRLKTAKYGVSHQRKRKGDANRRPPTYTQAQTHSCKRRVRRFLFWWRRGESNSGPRKPPDWHLQAQSLVLSRTLCAQRHARGVPTGSVLACAIPITCAGAFP